MCIRDSVDLAVLHCTTAYPVPPEQANISAILQLKKELGCTIGYSDHTLGVETSLLAIALGARVIEKHFTIDKNKSDFRDHQLSANSSDFRHLITKSKEILTILGPGEKLPQKVELEIKELVRRSIVAKNKLTAGTVVKKNDLLWLRPGNGLPPGQEHLVVGKKLLSTVEAGEPILPHDLQDN
jgi:N,N'-diacetyllegionaminate synthase